MLELAGFGGEGAEERGVLSVGWVGKGEVSGGVGMRKGKGGKGGE